MSKIEMIIPPMSGMAFKLKAGDVIEICDITGGQPGDFVAFNRDNHNIRFWTSSYPGRKREICYWCWR